MTAWGWVLGASLLVAAGCGSIDVKQDAITRCRDLGYISATKDAGAWYCYKESLPTLEREAQPKKAPKVVPP